MSTPVKHEPVEPEATPAAAAAEQTPMDEGTFDFPFEIAKKDRTKNSYMMKKYLILGLENPPLITGPEKDPTKRAKVTSFKYDKKKKYVLVTIEWKMGAYTIKGVNNVEERVESILKSRGYIDAGTDIKTDNILEIESATKFKVVTISHKEL